jgi:hypothetical protein
MDWQRFFDENYIHYVTAGPNTKRGEISIKCPMCGQDDPSEHMGVNLVSGYWGCHRNQAHRGKSNRYLIKALLGCSAHQAQSIIRQYGRADPDDTMSGIIDILTSPARFVQQQQAQKHNPEFDTFHEIYSHGSTERFYRYLKGRGFGVNTGNIIERYKLKCATVGKYKDRVIIPTYHSGELIAWTSRAIGNPKNAPRYLASSDDLKATIFNYDNIKKGGKRLFVTEGPFDAIIVDAFLHHYGVDQGATCTFGTSVTPGQFALLRKVVKDYNEVFVLFDSGAETQSAEVAEWIGARQAILPTGVKDPGELNVHQLAEMRSSSFIGWFLDYSGFGGINQRASYKWQLRP